MPVFISYSRKDRDFVQRLATNLVRQKAHVWLDEWEIAAGESLIEKVQSGIQGAGALIAVFSKASVESTWCKREVTAAIQRELEERKVIVIPAIIEDCDLPLFLRDKKYADFRQDFDNGLDTILVGISKVVNPSLGRFDGGKYHNDWSIDSGYLDGLFFLEFTIVQHSSELPYSVLSRIVVVCSEEATIRYKPYQEAGLSEFGQLVITASVLEGLEGREFFVLLEDAHKKTKAITFQDPKQGLEYHVHLESRRLGEDTGRDILMHGADELRKIHQMSAQVVKPLSNDEEARLKEIVRRNWGRNNK